MRERPFRAPHHTVSTPGWSAAGSGRGPARSRLAHRGVLFLDELPEFTPQVLEVLRQPLEDRRRHHQPRASGTLTFPAS